jgi:hypothetical protein
MKTTIIVLSALLSVISAIDIDCEFKERSVYNLGLKYSCVVTSVSFTGSMSLNSASGRHQFGKYNEDVKQIFFKNEGLEFIPQNILEIFPNIIGMHLTAVDISSLCGDELQGYENLEWFSLYNSTVDKIPGNFFEYNTKLRAVGFSWNEITKTGSGLFDNLPDLVTLYFRGNTCHDDFALNNRYKVKKIVKSLKVKCHLSESMYIGNAQTLCRSRIEKKEEMVFLHE